MGMDIIETGDADAFKKYLKEYDNTICGRHPISVFLHVHTITRVHDSFFMFVRKLCLNLISCLIFQMLKNSAMKININFLQYEQSSQCRNMRDSSVSYASAAAKLADDEEMANCN